MLSDNKYTNWVNFVRFDEVGKKYLNWVNWGPDCSHKHGSVFDKKSPGGKIEYLFTKFGTDMKVGRSHHELDEIIGKVGEK